MTMLRLATAAIGGAAILLLSGASFAGPEQISVPADYAKTFKRYAEVDLVPRKVVRYYFTQPASLKAAKPGQPTPEGTVILMEDHKAKVDASGNPVLDKNGKFVPEPDILAFIIQEKEKGWGADYPADKRNGEWEYAVFSADGKPKDGVKYDGCFSCHKLARESRDYTFTFAKYVMDHPDPKTR